MVEKHPVYVYTINDGTSAKYLSYVRNPIINGGSFCAETSDFDNLINYLDSHLRLYNLNPRDIKIINGKLPIPEKIKVSKDAILGPLDHEKLSELEIILCAAREF